MLVNKIKLNLKHKHNIRFLLIHIRFRREELFKRWLGTFWHYQFVRCVFVYWLTTALTYARLTVGRAKIISPLSPKNIISFTPSSVVKRNLGNSISSPSKDNMLLLMESVSVHFLAQDSIASGLSRLTGLTEREPCAVDSAEFGLTSSETRLCAESECWHCLHCDFD